MTKETKQELQLEIPPAAKSFFSKKKDRSTTYDISIPEEEEVVGYSMRSTRVMESIETDDVFNSPVAAATPKCTCAGCNGGSSTPQGMTVERSTIMRLESDVAFLRQESQKMAENLEHAYNESQTWRSQYNESSQQSKSKDEELEQLRLSFNDLRGKYEKTNSEEEGKDRIIYQLQHQLSESSHLTSSVDDVNREKESLLGTIDVLKKRNYELDNLFKTSEGDKGELQKLVSDMRMGRVRRISNLEAENETIQSSFDNETRALKDKIIKLESAVQTAHEERKQFISQLDSEKSLSQKYKMELERLQRECVEYKTTSESYNGLMTQNYGMEKEMLSLMEQVNKYENIQKVSEQRLYHVEGENARYKKEAVDFGHKINALEHQLEENEKANRNYSQQKMKDFEESLREPRNKIRSLETAVVTAQETVRERDSVTARVQHELQDSQNQNNALRRMISSLEGGLQKIGEEKNDIECELINSRKEITDFKSKLDESMQETHKFQGEVLTLNYATGKNDEQLTAVLKQRDEYKIEYDDVTRILADLREDLHNTQAQLVQERATVQHLRTEIKMRDDLLEEAKQRIMVLDGELQCARSELAKKQQEIAQLTEKNNALEEEVRVLRLRVSDLEVANQKLAQEIIRLSEEVKTLTSKHNELCITHGKCGQERAEIQRSFTSLEMELKSLREITRERDILIERLNKELQEAHQQIHSLQNGIRQMETLIATFEQEKENLQKQLSDAINKITVLESTIATHQQNIHSINEELKSLKIQYNELKDKYDNSEYQHTEVERELRQRISKLEPQFQATVRENEELLAKIKALEEEVRRLNEEKRNLRNENDDLHRITHDQTTAIEKLTSKLSQLHSDNERQQGEIQRLTLVVANLEETKVKLDQQLQSASHTIKHLEDNLKEVQSKRDELQAELHELQHKMNHVKEEVLQTQHQLGETLRTVERQQADLKHKDGLLEEARERILKLDGQLKSTQNELAKKQLEYDALNEEKVILQSEITALRQKVSELESANQNLKLEKVHLSEQLVTVTQAHNELCITHEQCDHYINSLEAELASLRDTVRDRVDLIERLQCELNDARNENNVLRRRISEIEGIVQRMEHEKHDVESQLANIRKLNAELESINLQLAEEKHRLGDELKELNRKYNDLIVKYDKSEHERTEIVKQLRESEQRISKIEPQLQATVRENTELLEKVKQLEDQLRNLSEKNRYLKNTNDNLQRTTAEQEKQIHDKDRTIEEMKNKLMHFQSENRTLEQEIQRLKSRIEDLEEEVRRLKSRNTTLEQEPRFSFVSSHTHVGSRCVDREKQLIEKIDKLEGIVSGKNTVVNRLTVAKDALEQDRDKLRKDLYSITITSTSKKDTEKELRDTINELQSKITTTEIAMEKVKSERDDVKRRLESKSKITTQYSMSDQVDSSRGQYSRLRFVHIENELSDMEYKYESAQKEVTRKDTIIEELRQKVISYETKLTGLQQTTIRLQLDSERTLSDKQRHESEIAKLAAEIKQLQEKMYNYDELQRELNEALLRRAAAQAEMDNLIKHVDKLQRENSELRTAVSPHVDMERLEKERDEYVAMNEQLSQHNNVLREELEVATSRIQRNKDDMTKSSHGLNDMKLEIQRLTHRNAEKTSKLHSLTSEMKGLEMSNASLHKITRSYSRLSVAEPDVNIESLGLTSDVRSMGASNSNLHKFGSTYSLSSTTEPHATAEFRGFSSEVKSLGTSDGDLCRYSTSYNLSSAAQSNLNVESSVSTSELTGLGATDAASLLMFTSNYSFASPVTEVVANTASSTIQTYQMETSSSISTEIGNSSNTSSELVASSNMSREVGASSNICSELGASSNICSELGASSNIFSEQGALSNISVTQVHNMTSVEQSEIKVELPGLQSDH